MLSCQRCHQTHSRPDAFLLTCRGCSKSWHHRCLMTPMEDQDLIRLIRATNAGDTANDLNSWTCRRCKKRTSATPSVVSSSERPSPPTHSYPAKAARKFVGTAPATSTEDDVEMQMQVDSPAPSQSVSRATSYAPSSIDLELVAQAPAPVRAANATDQETRPAGAVAIQPRVDQGAPNELDDDPEDLYGPPVERRIIRILPSLAEELREQQRRVAAEKERRRAPLAPDWILARHVNDPMWKETMTEGRKRRKPIARKLEDNGLNVGELMGCFTVQNWVREHRKRT